MATVTVRPNATTFLSSGAFAGVVPSGTAHAATDDSPANDSTYVNLGSTAERWDFTTSAPTALSSLSSGAVPKSYRFRFRSKRNTAATCAYKVTNLANSANAGGYITWDSFQTINSLTGTLASWTGMSWRMNSQTNAAFPLVSEVYVDMTYVAKPVTNASTNAATYTSNQTPTALWTNTLDADGGSQVRYQVKVYNEAQYTAFGFSPSSTIATVFDSGIVSSGVNNRALTTLNANKYRAYVRVAQSVNGALHWSSYDYAAFTVTPFVPPVVTPPEDEELDGIDYTPAAPTAVTGTADDENHRIELHASLVGGGTPTQLLSNGGFATNTTGWTATTTNFTTAGLTRQTADWTGHASGYAQLTGIKDANATERTLSAATATGTNGIAVDPSTAYALGAFLKASDTTTTGGFRLRILWYKSNGNASDVTVSSASDLVTIANGEEDTLYLNATSPSDAAYAAVQVEAVTSTSGDTVTFYFDGVVFTVRPSSDHVEFERSLDDGDTWEPVRALTAYGQPVSSLSATAYDYETGNGVNAKYRARGISDNGEDTFSFSAYVESSEVTGWTSSDWVLKAPTRPDLNTVIHLQSLPNQDREARTAVFQPLGSSRSIAISETRGTASGAMSLLVDTEEERDALDEILSVRSPLLIHSVPAHYWDDRYVVFDSWQRVRAPDKAYIEASIDSSTWREVEPTSELVDLEDWPDVGS